MTGPLVLLSLSLKRARTLLLATGLLLAVFQVLLVLSRVRLSTPANSSNWRHCCRRLCARCSGLRSPASCPLAA